MAISTRAEYLLGCGIRVYGVGRQVGDGTFVVLAEAAKKLGCLVVVITPAMLKNSRTEEFARVGVSAVAYTPQRMVKGLPVDDAGCEWLIVELTQGSDKILSALDAHIPLYKGCWIIETRPNGKQLSTYFELKHGLYKTHV